MSFTSLKDYVGYMIGTENFNNFFEFFFDSLIIGKSITSLEGKIFVNHAFSKMLGYSREELQEKIGRALPFLMISRILSKEAFLC